jgi:hypothetical protein
VGLLFVMDGGEELRRGGAAERADDRADDVGHPQLRRARDSQPAHEPGHRADAEQAQAAAGAIGSPADQIAGHRRRQIRQVEQPGGGEGRMQIVDQEQRDLRCGR